MMRPRRLLLRRLTAWCRFVRLGVFIVAATAIVLRSLPMSQAQEPTKPAAAAQATPTPSATSAAVPSGPVPSVQLTLPPVGGPMTALPSGKEPAADDLLGQLLFSNGIDDILLGRFVDGRPLDLRSLDSPERAPLLGLFASLRRIRPVESSDVILTAEQPSAFASPTARGKLWRVEGRLKSITIEQFGDADLERVYADVIFQLKTDPQVLPASDVRRFFFRSEVLFGGRKIEVISLLMPEMLLAKQSKLSDHPLTAGETIEVDERVTIDGLFLKSLGEKSGEHPVLVTNRPAWHPDSTLGKLGMDYGLYDDVRLHSDDLEQEHECFFQLLAAMKRANFDDLLRETDENYSVQPIFNSPTTQYGKLVALKGLARRATLVSVPYPEIRRRFGIDHYYEVAIFTADSRDNPLLFALLELPPGFPEGDDIRAEVRIPGTFLTGFYYDRDATTKEAEDNVKPRAQKAPLLIGKTLYRYSAESTSKAGELDWYVSGLIGIGVIALVLVAWSTMRGDKQTRRLMERTNAPPPGTSLNDLPGDFPSGPDFSNLDAK